MLKVSHVYRKFSLPLKGTQLQMENKRWPEMASLLANAGTLGAFFHDWPCKTILSLVLAYRMSNTARPLFALVKCKHILDILVVRL